MISEITITADDIGVLEETLDFEFPNELRQQVILNNLLLVHDFESINKVSVDFSHQKDSSESALA